LRRTSTIDTFRPHGFGEDMQVVARARDLYTDADGAGHVVATAAIDALVGPQDRALREITAEPGLPALATLVGRTVGPGFRRHVDNAVPELVGTGDLRYLLLDDMPGAELVAGYARLASGAPRLTVRDEFLDARADLCAGWVADGTMMTHMREHRAAKAPPAASAPLLTRADDPDAWHALPELLPHTMRRLRRIDVGPCLDEAHAIDVFFRDTHVDGTGLEGIVHEYSVQVTVDARQRVISGITATADVLPYPECPNALGSAARLVGHPLEGLRPHVRETFVGNTTCTHLNDVLRGLTDVDTMIDVLASHALASLPDI
jgi:hypothetical protein